MWILRQSLAITYSQVNQLLYIYIKFDYYFFKLFEDLKKMHSFYKPRPTSESFIAFAQCEEYKTLTNYIAASDALLIESTNEKNWRKNLLAEWTKTFLEQYWGDFEKIKIVLEVAYEANVKLETSNSDDYPTIRDIKKILRAYPTQLSNLVSAKEADKKEESKKESTKLKVTKTGIFTKSDFSKCIIALLNKISSFKGDGVELDVPRGPSLNRVSKLEE